MTLNVSAPKPLNYERLGYLARQFEYPLIFATVSGSHLFGFPSVDSDVDLRGFHYVNSDIAMGLDNYSETIEVNHDEYDIVTQEARKAFRLLCRNGNMLEQIHSPLVVHSTHSHDELKDISLKCITRHHVNHYFGFADAQRHMFEQRKVNEIKPILYTYRIILAGIHLIKTHVVLSDITPLANLWASDDMQREIRELIAEKLAGEHTVTRETRMEKIRRHIDALHEWLEAAEKDNPLPEQPAGWRELNSLLLRLRNKNP